MISSRVKSLQAKLKENEALIILKPENRFYASAFTGSSAYLVLTSGDKYLLTDFRYIEQAKSQALGYKVIDYKSAFLKTLEKILVEHGVKTLLFEEDYLTYEKYQSWQKGLGQIELQPAKKIVEKNREIKDEAEIELLQKAAQIADLSFNKILSFIKPGVREDEIALELEFQMRKLGATGPSFETIVASGIRSSMPHGVASDKALQIGDLIVFDFGAVYKGYHSDMSRTVVLGKANQEQKKIYQAVLEAQLKALEGIEPGMTCENLDKVARKHLASYGYDLYFGHSLGHGVGLAIHEEPRIAPGSKEILLPGMAITIEPGVYISEIGGVRIEDLVVVTEKGHLNLTASPKDLIEI